MNFKPGDVLNGWMLNDERVWVPVTGGPSPAPTIVPRPRRRLRSHRGAVRDRASDVPAQR